MFAPFSVQCLSCRGRLKVTDEALIGNIVSCPACGSMVQIDAPETMPPNDTSRGIAKPSITNPNLKPDAVPRMVVGSESVDSEEMTRDDLDAGAFSHEPASPLESDAAAEFGSVTDSRLAIPFESSVKRSAGGDASGRPTPPPPPPRDSATSRLTQSKDADSTGAPPSEPVSFDSQFAGESTQKIKKRVAIAVASIGAALVVAMVVLAVFKKVDSTPIAETGEDVDTAASAPVENPLPLEKSSPDLSLDLATAEPPDAMTTLPKDDPAGQGGDQAAIAPDDETLEANPEAVTEITPTSKMNPPAVIRELPLGDVKGEMNRRDLDSLADNPKDAVKDPLFDLPPELEAFTKLLDLPGNAPDAAPMTELNEAADEWMLDRAADEAIDPMLLATPMVEVEIDNVLKFRVAVQNEGYPLADWLLLTSEITQVPVQIDWVTLSLADVSISQRIRDDRPGWKTVGELLDSIATQAGLVLERQEQQLFLTLSEPEVEKKFSVVLDLADFGGQRDATKQWIEQFVSATSWTKREQLGLRALITDGLRQARGLPPKLSADAQSLWTVRVDWLAEGNRPKAGRKPEPLRERWSLLTGGESGNQLDTSITLSGFLRRTARLNDVACVVNWDDVRKRRLSPTQLVLPFADQPAAAMLSQTLTPMGLQTRVTETGQWWVGTASTYDRMPLLVIGDELGPNRDEIMQRIRQAASSSGTLVLLQHDPESDRYISLMPRFLYRQLPTILNSISN